MKRKRRNLDREADEQRHPDGVLEAPAELIERPHRQRLGAEFARLRHHDRHVEGVRLDGEIKRENGDQHESAAEQRVEKELDRGVFAARPAPDADQEVHRQQHHFPENEEQEKIESAENAHHAGVEQEKQREVAFDRLVDAKGSEDAEKAQQRRQQHHGDAEAVDAHDSS